MELVSLLSIFYHSLTTGDYPANDVMTYVGPFFDHLPQASFNVPRQTSFTLLC
jgi:hypothetical protein